MTPAPLPSPQEHLAALRHALDLLEPHLAMLERWGSDIHRALSGGARLLAVGNGGSAAEAQHLTSELVGRYRDDRPPASAIAIHADTSSVTAIANDYGVEEMFARQVRAHARPGDVVVALSTSGSSANVLAAVAAARAAGAVTLALTGRGPNPLVDACHEALCVAASATATIQEVHLVAIHVLCEAYDRAVFGENVATMNPKVTA